MLAIQMRSGHGAKKELRAIRVGSSVSHGQDSRTGVLETEVFVIEFATVNGFAPSTIKVGEVSSLAHEVRDDTVESGAW